MRKAGYIMALGLLVALLMGAAGCSFIFDFTECKTNADCQQFDNPAQGEFFMCSQDDKCVLEPERECRADTDCPSGQSCNADSGKCSGSSS